MSSLPESEPTNGRLSLFLGDEQTPDAESTAAGLPELLDAWQSATSRLERTHALLRDEVARLTSELEVKNRELARKNRLADLGEMASHVAHEVRNSLTPITLYLSLLRRSLANDPQGLETLTKAEAGFTALGATVNDLLAFSANRQPQLTSFVISELLEEVTQSLAPQLQAQQVELEIDAPIEIVAEADREMLRRAVLNLVLNALDVMPRGGELVITACEAEDGLEIEVADSGPGLGDEAPGRLFEPFFSTKETGTGLGLSVVSHMAEAHGGSVDADNCPEGGAAFTLCLPQATPNRAAA